MAPTGDDGMKYIIEPGRELAFVCDGEIKYGHIIINDEISPYMPQKLINCKDCAWWGDNRLFPDKEKGDEERKFCPELEKYPTGDDWCCLATPKSKQ